MYNCINAKKERVERKEQSQEVSSEGESANACRDQQRQKILVLAVR